MTSVQPIARWDELLEAEKRKPIRLTHNAPSSRIMALPVKANSSSGLRKIARPQISASRP